MADRPYRPGRPDYEVKYLDGPDTMTDSEIQGQDRCAGAHCGLLKNSGTKSLSWRFVGEGKGSFSPLQSYEYVGRGQGAFEKEVVTMPGAYSWPKIALCISVPLCLLLTILAASWVLTMASSQQQKVQQHIPAVAEKRGGLDFDCEADYAHWHVKWSPNKQHWCCAKTGRACVAPASADLMRACTTQCDYMGHTATCAYRVQWGASHRFKADSNACDRAWTMVAGQCPMCQACPLAATHCQPPR